MDLADRTANNDFDQDRLRSMHFLSRAAFLVGVGLLSYVGSFGGQFVFDDSPELERFLRGFDWNEIVRHRRPLLTASLGFNYAFGLTDPRGYHLFNFVVHAVTGVCLFLVAYRSLRLSSEFHALPANHALNLAWAASLIWIVHPLNTQAVTYIVQRCESMAAMCAMLALLLLTQADKQRRTVPWLIAMIVSCWAGFASKQVAVAIPFLLILFDSCFPARGMKTLLKRRGWCHALLLLSISWFLPDIWPTTVADGNPSAPVAAPRVSAGFDYAGATPRQYAATQPGVILYYLRLAVWPDPLCFDYRWPLETDPIRIAVTSAIIFAMLGVAVWGLWHRRWWSFWVMAAFLWLAPTSSVLPIADPMFEHRMYFPLACLTVVTTVLAWQVWTWLAARSSPTFRANLYCVAVTGLVVVFAGLTHLRNLEYQQPIRLWLGAASMNPGNSRAQIEIASWLYRENRWDEALIRYRLARESCGTHAYDCMNAEFGLGLCRLRQNEVAKAEAHFVDALKLTRFVHVGENEVSLLLDFSRSLQNVEVEKRLPLINGFFEGQSTRSGDRID